MFNIKVYDCGQPERHLRCEHEEESEHTTACGGIRDSLLWWESAKHPVSSFCLQCVQCNSHLIRSRTEVEHNHNNHNCFCIQTVDDTFQSKLSFHVWEMSWERESLQLVSFTKQNLFSFLLHVLSQHKAAKATLISNGSTFIIHEKVIKLN